jgi:hypothetical protein
MRVKIKESNLLASNKPTAGLFKLYVTGRLDLIHSCVKNLPAA